MKIYDLVGYDEHGVWAMFEFHSYQEAKDKMAELPSNVINCQISQRISTHKRATGWDSVMTTPGFDGPPTSTGCGT